MIRELSVYSVAVWVADLAFLVDMMKHFNTLNVNL